MQLRALFDGAYGKYNNHSSSYANSYPGRCQCDLMFEAGRGFGAYRRGPTSNNSNYLADFWKLREIGLNLILPESLTSRIGAERASLSLSGREIARLWQAQDEILAADSYGGRGGIEISDPETGIGIGGESNFFTMPPISNFSATLRVTF